MSGMPLGFVQLTENGESVALNVHHMVKIAPSGEGHTVITMLAQFSVAVQENYDDVLRACEKARLREIRRAKA
jgi:uncharacterized protein YlzI (FlbEa/FlbD family)